MKILFLSTCLLFSIVSCDVLNSDKHLINDKDYRKMVHNQFLVQKELAKGRDPLLFGVFDQELTMAEKEGLEFLYAFMPLSDLAINDGEYNLMQVRTALNARDVFSWGKDLPEDIFLHYVLPYRVNNEYTDTARQVFFTELKDRIKGMDMVQAALEVNHWCHEKVNYKSTDERTSGPLTTVRTAFGRCGEESTFTAAALRSVCIPARQVYTPRWAHTDDNHAWVEVWVEGRWHFLGACEPEPALDMAWFAEPVKRAMMTHTFVYGKYHGSEEVLEDNERYARLNLLTNYTKTRSLQIVVLGLDGKPVEDARVEFMLYNYAEFYPVATRFTDKNGLCKASTGFGDLMIWASKDGQSGYQFASASADTIRLSISWLKHRLKDETITLYPPVKQVLPPTDQSKVEENNKRLRQEDSIRNDYTSTFIDSLTAVRLAGGKDIDPLSVWGFLARSRGNWKEIAAFIRSLSPVDAKTGVALLAGISEKDLHDVRAEILTDHLNAYKSRPTSGQAQAFPGIEPFILSPRIGREFITKWRSFIQDYFSHDQAILFNAQPVEARQWIKENIRLDTISNYYNVPMNPEGVLQLRVADKYSRDLLFVAICRSFGVPARLEPATRVPQFFDKGWKDVYFEKPVTSESAKGEIVLENGSDDQSFIPQYYSHYTIARMVKGRFNTLDYEFDQSLKTFPCKLQVDTGYYRLVTGNRQPDGSVICNIKYFEVLKGQSSKVSIRLSTIRQESGVLGKIDLQASFLEHKTKGINSLAKFQSVKGMIIALIDPGKEPTKHLMEDIKAVKAGLDDWGGQVLFIVAKDKLGPGFTPVIYKSVPVKSTFGFDEKGDVAAIIRTVCSREGSEQLPAVVLVNNKGEITWNSEGYSIGTGDQMLKQIKKMSD